MDVATKKAELESQQRELENYLQHPVTVELLKDIDEQSEMLVNRLCNSEITDIESFFKHFQAMGHLRGLRRAKAMLAENLEEVKEQLKELM